MIDQLDAGPAQVRAEPVIAGGDPYRWALDPLQRFDSLLRIAKGLAHSRPAPTDRLTGDPVTNLYLVVCGLDQVLSDHLHRHFYDLDRAGFPRPVRRTLKIATTAEHSLRRLTVDRLSKRLQGIDDLLLRLARALAAQMLSAQATPSPDVINGIEWVAAQPYPASLRRSLLKLPQSFRGVDLYPEDCALLAERVHELAGNDRTPVAVIGLRTSGLYMAPICAAELDWLGRPNVELMSLRPGSPTLPAEERRLRSVVARGGWAFVVDDPTWRGSAFAKTLATLEKLGFKADRVCLAACQIGNQPVFRYEAGDGATLPANNQGDVWPGFRHTRKVVLRTQEWRIHHHLSDMAAERCLNRPESLARLQAERVRVRRGHPFTETGEPPEITGVQVRRRQRRFHAQKVFEVEVDRLEGRTLELVAGRGVGLGFFGYHSWLIGQSLDGAIPEVLGLDRGVLFTRWLPGGPIDPGSLSRDDLDTIAGYVARRANTLDLDPQPTRVPETRAVYSGARQVARALGRTMGGVGSLAQFRGADAISRVLAPPRRSAIDAQMGPAEWVRSESGGLLKVDFEEHGFDITDRWVTDAVHDVAAASVRLRLDADAERHLLETYTRVSGDSANLRARMVLHKLLAGGAILDELAIESGDGGTTGLRNGFAGDLVATDQALTRTLNGYLAGLYLSGVTGKDSGAIWAIDLDDTLETDWLGFQATSPAGAMALRTLRAHDQLVVVSTGRSLEEVRDRCATYGIAGGIAEYGAVAWDARRQRVLSLLQPGAKGRLDRLRQAVLAETDILADPRYQHSLRLFRPTPDGRRGMKVDEIEEIIERHGIEGLEVVEGYRKTVVWAVGTDKSAALLPLLESLGVDRGKRRLHVIGDEFTDLGLMGLADRRHAPANATEAVRSRAAELGIEISSASRAAGVLEIARRATHVAGRHCSACAGPRLDPADKVLVDLLGVQDRRRLRRFAFALHPASLRAFEL